MTRLELYRQVFNVQGGKEVLADLAGVVKQMPPAESSGAGRLLAHIIVQLNQPDPPAKKNAATRGTTASGGRIAHG